MNPKDLLGVKKAPLHLVPPVSIAIMSQAFADGAAKYGPYNWRENPVSASVYQAANLRHGLAWWDGQDYSADAMVHHIGHRMACDAILLDALSLGILIDDRPKPGAAVAVFDEIQDWMKAYGKQNTG